MISFCCRWFAFEIGYSLQYDLTGIWICGPIRKQRAENGRLRWECRLTFWRVRVLP